MTLAKLAQYWKLLGGFLGAASTGIAYLIAHQFITGTAAHDLTTILPYAVGLGGLIGTWRAPANVQGSTLVDQVKSFLQQYAALVAALPTTPLATLEQQTPQVGGPGSPPPPTAGYITPQLLVAGFLVFVAALGSLLAQPAMVGVILCVVAVVLAIHQGWWRGLMRKIELQHGPHPTRAVHARAK